MRQPLSAFARCRSGAVAVLFGLSLLPLLAAVSAAVDYGRANAARTRFLAAADAAVLAAVGGRAAPESEEACTDAATRAFRAQPNLPDAERVRVRCHLDRRDESVSARVSFEAEVPTTLGRAVGWRAVAIGGTAEALRAAPAHIDFHVALDVSPSMGLAATPAAQARLVALTGCAFACHSTEGAPGPSNHDVARANAVVLRVDALREATKRLIDSARAATRPERYRFGVHPFGATARTLVPVTGNLVGARVAVDAVDIDDPGENPNGATSFADSLPAIDAAMGPAGDGARARDPQKYLVLATDGIADDPRQRRARVAPLDPALCAPMKRRGVRVAVVRARALPNGITDGIAGAVVDGLRACASPGLYFEADTPEEIDAAFQRVFAAVDQARLSR